MIKNYFKIAWRNLLKNKAMFGINILGLAIGIASCLVISLFVVDELSFDRFNENADRIVRVTLKAKLGDENIRESSVMAPVGSTLEREFSEVLSSTRLKNTFNVQKVNTGSKKIRSGKMAQVDPNFFDIFTLKFLKGNAKTALENPAGLVLSSSQANTYFGKEDAYGKTLELEGFGIYTVSGIIEDVPQNSHFQFDMFSSLANNEEAKSQSWMSGSFHTYLLLDKNTSSEALEKKLPVIAKKYMGSEVKAGFGMSFDEFLSKGNSIGLFLQPLTKIHLYSNFTNPDLSAGGDIKTVYMFGAIALFMLLIACINFMNLSTAGASKRLKEIGMRKVLGSAKKQLVVQFLAESFLVTLVAMVLGVAMVFVALPYFNDLSGKSLDWQLIVKPLNILLFIVLTLFISLLAGAYPAFFMSSFKPLASLKNRFSSGGNKGIRSGLVVFQFSVSVALILATLVVGQQMDYINKKDMGYQRDNLIVMRHAGLLGSNLSVYKEQLLSDPKIKSITMSAFIPAGPTDDGMELITTSAASMEKLRTRSYSIDEAYIPTLGMTVEKGRNFSPDFSTENQHVILNQTAVKTFGLEGEPVGQMIYKQTKEGSVPLTVIGVVKDFHARSLHEPIEPMIMQYNPYYGLILKTNTADLKSLLSSMQQKWEAFGTGEAFEYAFMDQLFNETYVKEANMNTVLRYFALLTIFIACLGLYGLITFTTERRFKEIGIRKSLGSTVPQIVALLSKDFLKLIGISLLVAFPVGYYVMSIWLQDFEYRINMQWWYFAIAGVSTVVIALFTISFRSIKAANMDPVESLRAE
jgi:putative ABC transport system permease protein